MAQGAGAPGAADSWALPQAQEWCSLLIRAGLTPRLIYDRQGNLQAANASMFYIEVEVRQLTEGSRRQIPWGAVACAA